jgi:hypothetical protein
MRLSANGDHQVPVFRCSVIITKIRPASAPNAALKQMLVSGGRAGFKPRRKDVARSAFLLALSDGEGCAVSLAACTIVADFYSKAQTSSQSTTTALPAVQ